MVTESASHPKSFRQIVTEAVDAHGGTRLQVTRRSVPYYVGIAFALLVYSFFGQDVYKKAYPAFDHFEIRKWEVYDTGKKFRAFLIYPFLVKSSSCSPVKLVFYAKKDKEGLARRDVSLDLQPFIADPHVMHSRQAGEHEMAPWLISGIPSDYPWLEGVAYHDCPLAPWIVETPLGTFEVPSNG